MKNQFDVVIVGAGIVGLSCALKLAQEMNLRIAVIEKNSLEKILSSREKVSSMNLASQKFLQTIGIWDALNQQDYCEFTDIEVFDANNELLTFHARAIQKKRLGFIVHNVSLEQQLLKQLSLCSTVELMTQQRLQTIDQKENEVELVTDTGGMTASLVIGADGKDSQLRALCQINTHSHSYNESAIVATLYTQHAHQHCARQKFLSLGPIAFLPLADAHTVSIVWTNFTDAAKHLMAKDERAFNDALYEAFPVLGKVKLMSQRFLFPLIAQRTTNYIDQRVVLVGDAAHVVHPLAGLGLNMGLNDVRLLSSAMIDAKKLNRSPFARCVLRQYEREAKYHNALLAHAIDTIKHLYQDKKRVNVSRRFAFHILEAFPAIKARMIEQACGIC